jgi:hypothetical protein
MDLRTESQLALKQPATLNCYQTRRLKDTETHLEAK